MTDATDKQQAWDERFAAADRAIANMQSVKNACSTCKFADVPPMPDNPADGWLATCTAPLPVNVFLHIPRIGLKFAAVDAARLNSKRQKPCPAWVARDQ